MNLFTCVGTLLLVICGVYGDDDSVVTTAAPPAPTANPFYPNRNPNLPGFNYPGFNYPGFNYPGYNHPGFNKPGYNNPYYNPENAKVPILSYTNTQDIDGSYSYSYTTGDGKQAQETGFLKDAYVDNAGEPQGTQVKEGSFSYISPEGTPIQVTYVADERGFRPAGVHISADGRAPPPLPAPLPNGAKGPEIYDPRYNLYDPYNRNRGFGQFNGFNRHDPRYPYDPRNDLYNPYRPAPFFNKFVKDDIKKESA